MVDTLDKSRPEGTASAEPPLVISRVTKFVVYPESHGINNSCRSVRQQPVIREEAEHARCCVLLWFPSLSLSHRHQMAIAIAQLLYSPALDRRRDSRAALSSRVRTFLLLLASIVAMSVLFNLHSARRCDPIEAGR